MEFVAKAQSGLATYLIVSILGKLGENASQTIRPILSTLIPESRDQTKAPISYGELLEEYAQLYWLKSPAHVVRRHIVNV